jgi:hypothetical protein
MRNYEALVSGINLDSRKPIVHNGVVYALTQKGNITILDAEYFYLVEGKVVRENDEGYATVSCHGKQKRLHRLILESLFSTRQPYSDHIDRNRLNNLKENLRPCDIQQSSRNRKYGFAASRYKGVHRHASQQKWTARIRAEEERIYIGIFKTEIEAAKAYDLAAVKYFGEFAALNFPECLFQYQQKILSGCKVVQTHDEKFTSNTPGVIFVKKIRKWVCYYGRTYIGRFEDEMAATAALMAYKEEVA